METMEKTMAQGLNLPKPWRIAINVAAVTFFCVIMIVLLRFYADDSLNFFAFWSLFAVDLGGLLATQCLLYGIKWIKDPKNLALVGSLLIIFVYASFTYNKTESISDGWYITYARMILSGRVPYEESGREDEQLLERL